MVFGGLLDELKISFFFFLFCSSFHSYHVGTLKCISYCMRGSHLTIDRFHNAHSAKLEDSVRLKLVRNVVFTVVKKASAEEM